MTARNARKTATVIDSTVVTPDAPAVVTPDAPVVESTESANDTPTPMVALPTITVGSIVITTDPVAAATAYGLADTGTKTKIRNAIMAAMMDSVRSADIVTAGLWSAVSDAIAATKITATEPTDYNRVVADRIIALRYAAHRLAMGDVTPDGIESDAVDTDAVHAMLAEFESAGDPDAVSNEIASAGTRIATQKITRATVRGDIESHIVTAFAGMPVGTKLTVAQIRTRSGAASDGAIAARVWPRAKKDGTVVASTLDFHALGVKATVNADGVRAIEKVGEAN